MMFRTAQTNAPKATVNTAACFAASAAAFSVLVISALSILLGVLLICLSIIIGIYLITMNMNALLAIPDLT